MVKMMDNDQLLYKEVIGVFLGLFYEEKRKL